MKLLRLLLLLLLGIAAIRAEDAANDDAAAAADDDAAQAAADDDDDNYEQEAQYDDDYVQAYQGDDYIKYWTEYAILPKRCIVYNNVDVIVFSVFEHGYKQCTDDPMGTYYTPVGTFVRAYVEQLLSDQADLGNDDYATPDAVDYAECTSYAINNEEYWVQLGCTDGTSQSLSVNIYSENTCTIRDTKHGSDDLNVDGVTDLQLPFKKCQACVNWVDVNDDQVDDKFYENHQTRAPLCSTAWQHKELCDQKCQEASPRKEDTNKSNKEGWNTSGKMMMTIIMAILAVFGAGMLVGILLQQRRQKMSNIDALYRIVEEETT